MENELQSAFNHFKQGNYAAAWNLCQHILKTAPTQPDCLAMLGMMSNKAKRYADAEKYLRKCLFFHPSKHIILTELATALVYLDKLEEAEKILTESMDINSKYEKTYIQLAKLNKQTGRKTDAERLLRELLSINSQSAPAMNNLGTLLMEENKTEEALSLFRKVIEINPQLGSAYKNIALIELKNGNKQEALHYFSIAAKFFPEDADLLIDFANLLVSENKHSKAITLYEKTLEKQPDKKEILVTLGRSYQLSREFSKAIGCYEKALDIDANLSAAFYLMARCKTDLCDWRDWEKTRGKFISYLEKDIKSPEPVTCSSYDTHYYNIPDELQFRLMRRIAEKYNPETETKFEFSNRNHAKLRIGYISPDFRNHAVGMSVYQLFQHHNRNYFEIFAFSLVIPTEEDFIYRKIKADVDYFHDISKISVIEAAKLIYECEIDILVDFGAYTNHTKPEILAMKPAPIQIHMIGQPDTTGSDKYDFFVSDSLLIDEVNRKYYTENILYLPHGFICSPIKPSDKQITRKEIGIADDAFVFCSFCSPYKYEPKMFEIWMRILNEVENSVLWLLGISNQSFENNLRSFAQEHDVNKSRIIFSEYAPIEEHLNRYRLCDLFLDTLYYTSSSTGIHALMMGMPIVTYRGETNAMRQGASVCHAAGLDETICDSLDEYYQLAIDLANSPQKLQQLKDKLPINNPSSQYFDLRKDVGYMEKAYLKIWNTYIKQEKFTDIYID